MLSKGVVIQPGFLAIRALKVPSSCHLHSSASLQAQEFWWGPEKCAGREVVGFGFNGDEIYTDRLDFWYPAIRFRKDDGVILPIREKEKGDWKNMTFEDKKTLYRYSFRQTMSEFHSGAGYWKPILAGCIFVVGLALGYCTLLKILVNRPLPVTLQNEWKESMYERYLVLERGRFLGHASTFDYEKNEWK